MLDEDLERAEEGLDVLDRDDAPHEAHAELARRGGHRHERGQGLDVPPVGEDERLGGIGAVADLRLAVALEYGDDEVGVLIGELREAYEEPRPELLEEAGPAGQAHRPLPLDIDPFRLVDLAAALARIDAVLGQEHGATGPHASQRGRESRPARGDRVIHGGLWKRGVHEPEHRQVREAPRPVVVDERDIGRARFIDLPDDLPGGLAIEIVVARGPAPGSGRDPLHELGEPGRPLLLELIVESPDRFPVLGLEGLAMHVGLVAAMQAEIGQADDVRRQLVLGRGRGARGGADVEEGEADLGQGTEQLMNPGGHAARDIRIRAFENQADVRPLSHAGPLAMARRPPTRRAARPGVRRRRRRGPAVEARTIAARGRAPRRAAGRGCPTATAPPPRAPGPRPRAACPAPAEPGPIPRWAAASPVAAPAPGGSRLRPRPASAGPWSDRGGASPSRPGKPRRRRARPWPSRALPSDAPGRERSPG